MSKNFPKHFTKPKIVLNILLAINSDWGRKPPDWRAFLVPSELSILTAVSIPYFCCSQKKYLLFSKHKLWLLIDKPQSGSMLMRGVHADECYGVPFLKPSHGGANKQTRTTRVGFGRTNVSARLHHISWDPQDGLARNVSMRPTFALCHIDRWWVFKTMDFHIFSFTLFYASCTTHIQKA